MPNYALIKNKIVENIAVCESDEYATTFFNDFTVVNVDNIMASPGWTYDGKTFSAPEVELTKEEINLSNLEKANSEYSRATSQIDAINEQIEDEDWIDSTEEDVKSQLASWTDYRKKLRAYIKVADGSVALPAL